MQGLKVRGTLGASSLAMARMPGLKLDSSGPLLWDGEQASCFTVYGLGLLISEILQPYSLWLSQAPHTWASLHLIVFWEACFS